MPGPPQRSARISADASTRAAMSRTGIAVLEDSGNAARVSGRRRDCGLQPAAPAWSLEARPDKRPRPAPTVAETGSTAEFGVWLAEIKTVVVQPRAIDVVFQNSLREPDGRSNGELTDCERRAAEN